MTKIVFGEAFVDDIWRIQGSPSMMTQPGQHLGLAPGGTSANTAAWMAASGADVQYVVPLDQGEGSSFFRRACKTIDLSLIELAADHGIGRCLVVVDADGERRMVYSNPDYHIELPSLPLESPDLCWVASGSVLRQQIHQRYQHSLLGLPSVLLVKEALTGRQWDFVIGSVDDGPWDQELLETVGCKVAILTDGGDDTRIWINRQWLQVPVPSVDLIVDTIGAGDSFLAGTLSKLTHLDSLDHVLEAVNNGFAFSSRALAQSSGWPKQSF